MCKIMTVHPSGYYAWKADPVSPRAQDDQRVLGLLKHAWLESGGVYGYRKLTLDMRDLARIFHRSRATNEDGIALVCPKIQVSNLDQRAGNAEAKLYRRN